MDYFVKAVELKRDKKSIGWTVAIFGPSYDKQHSVIQDCAWMDCDMVGNGGRRVVTYPTADEAMQAYQKSDIPNKDQLQINMRSRVGHDLFRIHGAS